MQIYLQKSCGKMDFDEVLKLISAKMVDICGIYVCVYEKKAVILQREFKKQNYEKILPLCVCSGDACCLRSSK
jgi:hypothetical protein